MKAGFMLTTVGLVASSIITDGTMPTAFQVGSLVTFGASLYLGAHGYIRFGSRATVVSHNFETGLVELELRGVNPELSTEWGRILTLLPFQTEDALEALNFLYEEVFQPATHRKG